jgi:hypothetical protein
MFIVIFWILLNFIKYIYRQFPFEEHHKIEKKHYTWTLAFHDFININKFTKNVRIKNIYLTNNIMLLVNLGSLLIRFILLNSYK